MIIVVMVMIIMMLILLGSYYIATFEVIFKVAYNRLVKYVLLQDVKILNERPLKMSAPSQSWLMDLNLRKE